MFSQLKLTSLLVLMNTKQTKVARSGNGWSEPVMVGQRPVYYCVSWCHQTCSLTRVSVDLFLTQDWLRACCVSFLCEKKLHADSNVPRFWNLTRRFGWSQRYTTGSRKKLINSTLLPRISLTSNERKIQTHPWPRHGIRYSMFALSATYCKLINSQLSNNYYRYHRR